MVDFRPDVSHALFGRHDAENEEPERLKEYFYRNRAYDSLVSDMPIRIVIGHKGVGKSALLRMAHLEDQDAGRPSVWLQPSDLSTLDGTYDARFDKATQAWQEGLLSVLYNKIGEVIGGGRPKNEDNIVLATSRDLVAAIQRLGDKYLALNLDELKQAAIAKFTKSNKIFIYIDDLDRGFEGKRSDVVRLSDLLNALRDICGDYNGIQFRIGLRTDVYHLIRTSDESTDKVSQYLIPLRWTNHDILVCLAKRIATYFNEPVSDEQLLAMNQADIARHFHKVIDPLFHGAGKWEKAPIHRVLLSLTRRRPRDLVKLFTGAANVAFEKRHNKITSEDLRSTFIEYSHDRLQDIINEFKTEIPSIKSLVLGMRPTSKHRIGDHPFLYTTAELSDKIRNILSSNHIAFSSGEVADFHAVKQFLYKIDFIIARSVRDDGWVDWTYYDDNKFAASREADYGYSWEVHPAYRWALEKKSVQEIIDGTDLISV